MSDQLVQRWANGSEAWRPGNEPMNPRKFEVAPIPDDTTAKSFVVAHHYSRTYPAARFRFGLYLGAQLVGVAVFSHPVNDKALAVFPGSPLESVELGRFVLLDEVPGNGETWFLARCFEQLRREGLNGVLSFSDPTPRNRADGTLLHPGHVGIIYQASNGRYLGRGTPRTLDLLPDGRVLNARTQQKIRVLDSSWESAAALLEENGATPLRQCLAGLEPEAARAAAQLWLHQWKGTLTRKLRHPGNHRYVWGLRPAVRRHLPEGMVYPQPPGGRAPPRWGRRIRERAA